MTKQELYNLITTRGSNLCYPFNYMDNGIDYLDYIYILTNSYIKKLKELDSSDINELDHCLDGEDLCQPLGKPLNIIQDACLVSNLVFEVCTLIFKGRQFEAYEKLERFFTSDNLHYLLLLPQSIMKKDISFYRLRKNYSDKEGRGGMFHVPFELRHLVSNSRYGQPGYPVLYLCGSLYPAFFEINATDWHEVTYSIFKLKQESLFLDLSYPNLNNPKIWDYYSLFAFYPLLMATMVTVKHQDAPFKPEYVLPQLMMTLLRLHGSDSFLGIMYMSNKAPESNDLTSINVRNFAIMIQGADARKGYDLELAQKFTMTNPIHCDHSKMAEIIATCNGDLDLISDMIKLDDHNQIFSDLVLTRE